jgi:hypothetical protein
MSIRPLRARALTALAVLLGLAAASPGDAAAAPQKATFAVQFEGSFDASWNVRLDDGEPHHPCLVGDGAEGAVRVEAGTRGTRKARLLLDRRRGHVFGRVPLQAAELRTFTMGQAVKGCEEDHAESAGRLDCGPNAHWGRDGAAPAWLDVAAGRGGVSVSVARDQEPETIDRTWPFCPFWGARDPKIEGSAKLSTRRLLSGRPQTVTARASHAETGGEGRHAQEGQAEWRLTIRYVRPRPR